LDVFSLQHSAVGEYAKAYVGYPTKRVVFEIYAACRQSCEVAHKTESCGR